MLFVLDKCVRERKRVCVHKSTQSHRKLSALVPLVLLDTLHQLSCFVFIERLSGIMVPKLLWILGWVSAFLCLPTPASGVVYLREGQECGNYIQGHCESDLKCLPVGTLDEDSMSGGVCTKTPWCNCSEVRCPPHRRGDCRNGVATDPCGCCTHCGRLKGQVCGGPSWKWGYCDRGLSCTRVVGRELALPPSMGVCKVLPGSTTSSFENDPLCPWVWGCDVRVGNCDCYSEQSCHVTFSYDSYEACHKVKMADLMYDYENPQPIKDLPKYECKEWRCEVRGCQCDCQMRPCDYRTPLLEEKGCCKMLVEAGCYNASCPTTSSSSCPADSFPTEPYIEPGQCCPLIPSLCTCNLESCPRKKQNCPGGSQLKVISEGTGHPGNCCDRYECVHTENQSDGR